MENSDSKTYFLLKVEGIEFKMLNQIKKAVPYSWRVKLYGVRQHILLEQAYWLDKSRFSRNYSKADLAKNAQSQLEARLVFHAHSLEKGLSHYDMRLGFGKPALSQISKVMQIFNDRGFDKKSEAYVNAISVLNEYFSQHDAVGFDISENRSLFSEVLQADIEEGGDSLGGVSTVNIAEKTDNRVKNFKSLFLNRWSVRDYDASPVDSKLIDEAIEISKKSPSVCNRQSARVTIVTDPDVIQNALLLQGGFKGYDNPPRLLLVTADTATAVGVYERNQAFIDGGLFSMSLLMSLEFVKLAACPLNAMLSRKKEILVRELLEVPDNEVIIMFIAVGNFATSSKVPKSFRYAKLSRKIGH